MAGIPSIPKINRLLTSVSAFGQADPAAAYIAAITAAGATVSAPQQAAISTFISGEKTAGRWDKMKRLYFPVWGLAAANAICMKSLTSGTFTGTVTHTAGYVTSDGTTGHFLADVSPGGAGLTLNGSGAFALYTGASSVTLVNTQSYFGAQTAESLTRFKLSGGNAEASRFSFFGPNNTSFSTVSTSGDQRGVQFLGRDTSTNRFVILRQTSTLISSNSSNTSSALNSSIPMCWLANNVNGAVSNYVHDTARLGCAGMAEGLSQVDAENVTLAIKTLWETTTGLTLP